jgi:hypothetical protein
MRRFLIALSLAVAGCNSDLPPEWQIEKLRVLAVQAEPPEIAPGASTVLQALAVEPPVPPPGSPPPSPLSYVWLACTIPPGVTEQVPCGLSTTRPLTGADLGQATPPPDCQAEPGADLCLLGTDPIVRFTAPAGALAGARTTQMLITVAIADTPSGAIGCLVDTANNGGMPVDPDHCVLALKRLTVTSPTTPLSDGTLPVFNRNPQLTGFDLVVPTGDQASLLDGTAEFLPTPDGQSPQAALDAARADDAAELEPTFDSSGKVTGAQYEALTIAWYTTAGKLDSGRSAFVPDACATQQDCPTTPPPADVTTNWTPPTQGQVTQLTVDGTVQLWAVVRDDRGGISWLAGTAQSH